MENKVVRLKYIRKHFVVPIVTTSHNTRDGQSSQRPARSRAEDNISADSRVRVGCSGADGRCQLSAPLSEAE